MNVQGHLTHLRRRLEALGLWDVLTVMNLQLVSFPDLQLDPDLDDRSLWNLCQDDGGHFFTENRNNKSLDSLHATLHDSWRIGLLPILTLGDKDRFVNADQVANDVAEILFGRMEHEFRDQPRVYVPRHWH